jgi:hypothetical protein
VFVPIEIASLPDDLEGTSLEFRERTASARTAWRAARAIVHRPSHRVPPHASMEEPPMPILVPILTAGAVALRPVAR